MPPTPDPSKTVNSQRRVPDLNALIHAFDGFIYICSQDYHIQYMNDKLRERTGYDATGEYCFKILHGLETPCSWCNNDKLFRERKPIRWQLKSPKDERWYDIINTPIRNEDGTFSKQSLIMDITESYLAKEELSLFQNLINQSNDAIFVIDADTSGFIYVNNKACSNLGYSAAELLDLRVPDISMHDPDMSSWHNHVARIREQSLLFETEQIRKDRSLIPVEVNAGFVSCREKNFIVSVVRDISEHKAQTRALLEERNKLEALFATLIDGITVQDTDFKVLYQNKAHIDKQGVHTGEYCYQAYQHRETICDGCLLAQSFIDGAVHRRETTAPGENGLIHLEVTSSPMKDADGNIIAGIESARDITPQKRMEAQLRQAQKMEAIGTLAGGIAHDFNNILSPILGYSELALTRLSPRDPLTTDLQQITQAAGRAKELVQQILAFSRQAPQEKKPLQPHIVVQETLKLLRSSLPTTIEIRADISTECGTILADPTQIHQIIMNLCTNAYHAMRETGGVLGVSLTKITIRDDDRIPNPELVPGDYVLLEISDSGCGIEQRMIPHIFDPYFTTKTKEEGTGLGLSVVHGIVKSYQGHITVYSEPGLGTNFHIYLPRIEDAPFLTEAVHSETIPTGTEHLLVVDDEEIIATMLQLILQSLGYRITLSCNSLTALALIDQNPMEYDLLITDMTMPHLTGFELAQKARVIRADLPVILCTGFSELINKEQAQALGIQAYLMKPVSVQDLGIAVRKVLDRKKEPS
jgi:two-component system, cell cycle sensor histidine kinase and response regulator CckA